MAQAPDEPITYQVSFAKSASKQLAKVPPKTRQKIAEKIDALSENPRPLGVEKLEDQNDFYRIRVGDYRVIYAIHDDKLIVLVLAVGDRKEIYRYLKPR